MTDTTNMTDARNNQDPADIERDIRRTQEQMSRTVDQIGDQLTPRSIVNALLDKAESNDVDARALLDGARRNPLALAMIAGGTIWLISDNDAKLPSTSSLKSGSADSRDYSDPHHREYVSYMEKIERLQNEDPLTYQQRRDNARANYFMVERRHDEDDSGFRQRLDEMAEKFRERRRAWSEQGQRASESLAERGRDVGQTSRDAANRVAEGSREAVHKAQDLYTDNPIVGGLVAAAVGAVFGSLLPLSRTEEEQLSDLGEKARDMAGEQKDKLTEVAREKKDDLVARAEETAKPDQSRDNAEADANKGGGLPGAQAPATRAAPF